jgi:hypothetical protein
MKVVIEIELGNEAMQTGADVAQALGTVQHRIEDLLLPLRVTDEGPVKDVNGNRVGMWWVAR